MPNKSSCASSQGCRGGFASSDAGLNHFVRWFVKPKDEESVVRPTELHRVKGTRADFSSDEPKFMAYNVARGYIFGFCIGQRRTSGCMFTRKLPLRNGLALAFQKQIYILVGRWVACLYRRQSSLDDSAIQRILRQEVVCLNHEWAWTWGLTFFLGGLVSVFPPCRV